MPAPDPLTQSQITKLTARSGVSRSGAARIGAVGKTYQMKPGSGRLIWDRLRQIRPLDGDPAATAVSWVTGRE